MNILQSMSDPKAFASTFKRRLLRGDTWAVWKVFLAALFALPMDDTALKLYQHHSGRSAPPTQPFSEAFVIAGRRSGKSLIAALVAVFLACFRDYSGVLVGGETGVVMILSSDRRQGRVIFGYVAAFLETPMLKSMVVSKLKESIVLSNGVTIEIRTSDYRAVRGATIVGVVADELAFWPAGDSANPDTEVLNAVRPAMATVPNAILLCISSPYAKRGELFRAFREHYGKPESPVLVWKAASREMNPTLSGAVVAAAYLRDRSAAAAEYGGEFRDDVESFISLEIVEARIQAGLFERPPVASRDYVGFCDPSGGRSDSMTLAIAHESEGRAVLDLIREIQAPFSPEDAVSEFAGVLKQYRLSEVMGDKYAGEWPREQFVKRGIAYRVCEQNRSELYLELLPKLMSGACDLLDNPRLVTQLVGLERKTARAGKDSIDHAPGGHDDVANAVAGALVRARGLSMDWFIAQASWSAKPVAVTEAPHPTWQEVHKTAMEQAGMKVQRPSLTKPLKTADMRYGSAPNVCPNCGSNAIFKGAQGALCLHCRTRMPAASREGNLSA
jgi:Terminase large subunit, T4likevirus-type, N-terminal